MRSSRIALFITLGVVTSGGVGLAWISQHASPGGLGMKMMIQDNLSETLSPPPATSEARFEKAPSHGGLVAPSADSSLDAMLASQKLIRTGQMTLEVKAFDAAFTKLQSIASENGGYIADIKANRQDQGRASGSVTLRVQSNRYFQTLDALRAIGKVEQEGVNTQDVTKQYADLEGRLANKRRLETRMREILSTRASKMADLLEAEQQLSQVTEEIERLEGERRYFQQMVSMSTIQVELHEPMVAIRMETPGLFAPVAVAAKNSIEALIQLFAFLVAALVFLAPWLILGTGLWMGFRRLQARRKAVQPG